MVLRGCCAVRSLAREDRPIRLLMTTPRVGEGSDIMPTISLVRRLSVTAFIITPYLANGGALEHAQEMAAHESARTTRPDVR